MPPELISARPREIGRREPRLARIVDRLAEDRVASAERGGPITVTGRER